MIQTKQTINYPPLARVPGLTFRHFTGESDYRVWLDLWLENREFNGYEKTATIDDLKQEALWRKHYDINEQFIFVELYQKPIGYCIYSWSPEVTPKAYILLVGLNLLKDYWGGDIPQLMLNYMELKLAEMTQHLPADAPRLYNVERMQSAFQQIAFYKANGYAPERYFFEMIRPIDKPLIDYPLPDGLEIREVKQGHYRKIWKANEDAFRDHWGFEESNEKQYAAWQNERLFQPHLWKIAWDGDEVAGQVENFLDEKENEEFGHKRGYTEGISVGKRWRQQGLARALIAESIRMFRDLGMEETALGVDAENALGALQLYTDMGYEEQPEKTSIVLRKKITTNEGKENNEHP